MPIENQSELAILEVSEQIVLPTLTSKINAINLESAQSNYPTNRFTLVSPDQVSIEDSHKFKQLSLQEFALGHSHLTKITFNNGILFQTDKTDTFSDIGIEVKRLVDLYLAEKLGRSIYILGHTDSTGSRQYNHSLSLKRATSVAQSLVDYGIDSNFIKVVPAGESSPLSTNSTTKGRQRNRRVEILSADSEELIQSFIRSYDCESIDKACFSAVVPIFDIRNINGEIFLRSMPADKIVANLHELNDLPELAGRLEREGIQLESERSLTIDNNERDKKKPIEIKKNILSDLDVIKEKNLEVREPIEIPIEIRNPLDVKVEVRSGLFLSKKYWAKDI